MSNAPDPSRDIWEQLGDGLERLVIHGSSMTVTRYRFASGARFPLHRHEQEQFVYVVAGSIVFLVEGEAHPLTQGVTLLIEPYRIHEAIAEQGGAQVLSVVAPPRAGTDSIEMMEPSVWR